MGGLVSSLWRLIGSKRAVRIVMVGLDGSGKTSILYKLKLGDLVETVPTIGFNVETIKYKNLSFTVWDVGGQYKIRALWRYYYSGADAAIFVVDASDTSPDRLDESREEIHLLIRENDLTNAPVLIFANKQDLPSALGPQEIASRFDLMSLKERQWNVQACSAKTSAGIYEGLNWLVFAMSEKSKSQKTPFKHNSNSVSNETAHSILMNSHSTTRSGIRSGDIGGTTER